MTTLAIMKARIASEVRRSNISSQIASAITTAIEEYQKDRFAFTERRNVQFPTVYGQGEYTTSDSGNIPLLRKLDYAKSITGTDVFDLLPLSSSEMEELTYTAVTTGQPSHYTYYAEAFRFYPVPDGVYTIQLAGVFALAAPATDDTAGNRWMTSAERLIRSRAKLELAVHVLFDDSLIEKMSEAVRDAYSSLTSAANMAAGTGRMRPYDL